LACPSIDEYENSVYLTLVYIWNFYSTANCRMVILMIVSSIVCMVVLFLLVCSYDVPSTFARGHSLHYRTRTPCVFTFVFSLVDCSDFVPKAFAPSFSPIPSMKTSCIVQSSFHGTLRLQFLLYGPVNSNIFIAWMSCIFSAVILSPGSHDRANISTGKVQF
jgi:hypothetical protein